MGIQGNKNFSRKKAEHLECPDAENNMIISGNKEVQFRKTDGEERNRESLLSRMSD